MSTRFPTPFCWLLMVWMFAPMSLAGEDDSRPYGLTTRAAWTTSRVVGTPEPPPPYIVERAYPQLKFKNPLYIAQEPGTDRFLVGELSGKIWAFTKDTPDTESCELFLDIGRELYSFSFHPQYEQNGFVFTFSPRDPNDQAKTEDRKSRVSRYQATRERPRRCVPETETVIIEWPAGGHNGGEAIIGPDGYLYISTGDSTSGSDPKGTGQGVDDLLSVIMRIDVDHPDDGRAYSIPRDNPFVDYPGARAEIWAFGFRNPWRMCFDEKTGGLWVGDVGQDLWEMIWLVERGGNYGWSVQEGTHLFHPAKPSGPGPILPPVVEHHHTECRSITGGYVYYGDRFPELHGVYFYGDYEYGMIWGLRHDGEQVTRHQVLADTALRIPSFGVSRDGRILLMDHTNGELYELVRAPAAEANKRFPVLLSETGIFDSIKNHQVAPGVLAYSVNAPQWIDNATKQRFVALPGDSQIQFVHRSGDASTWGFEDGTVNVETISLEMEAGNSASQRRIETRILVKQQNHWLGYSYLWNDEQSDAALVESRGRDVVLTIDDASAPGGKRKQTWHVPSRNECMVCHSRAAGFVLGLRTEQMNRDYDYRGVVDNQLRAWNHIGMFKNPLEKQPDEYDALPDPYDSSAELAPRARAYLHVNCSVCHVSDGGGNSRIQLRYFQAFPDTNLADVPMHGTFGLPEGRIVAPGDPYSSVLLYRLAKWGPGRMPHVGSNLHDERGLELIEEWIASLRPEAAATGANGKGTESGEPLNHTDKQSVARLLLAARQLPAERRAGEIARLLASPRSAFVLARLLAQDVSTDPTRQQTVELAIVHPDPNIRDLFERFLPEDRRTKRLGDIIVAEDILKLQGKSEVGRQFFLTGALQCRTCHRVGELGGTIGPDLSQIGRSYKRHEILESLIDPSKKVDPQYATYVLSTTDGRVFTGIVAEKTGRHIALHVLDGGKEKQIRIASDEVDQLQLQKTSLMPDRLLRDLTAQQASDLLEFLMSLK